MTIVRRPDFAGGELGRRLVAICPTGRVFCMGVPRHIKTCEQAQQWLAGESSGGSYLFRT